MEKFKITDIVPQKHNSDRASIFVDGEYSFSLDKTDVIKLHLKVGDLVTNADIERMKNEYEYTKALSKAVNMLSHRPASQKQITDKLYEKGYDEFTVARVMEEIINLGLADDYEYASVFAEYAKEKCWGERKVRYELERRGIPRDIADDVLNEKSLAGYGEIMEIIKIKYKNLDLSDFKMRQRAVRFFSSRGFSFSDINGAINEYISNISSENEVDDE